MQAFLDPRQRAHDPRHFIANALRPNPEVLARVDILQARAEAAGCVFEAPQGHGIDPIAAIHCAEYLALLRTIHARWSRIDGAGAEVIPNIHPASRGNSYPRSAVGQARYHQADSACPISGLTWTSAYWSAQTALGAAAAVAGGAHAAYALCRPPGHHGFVDLDGGFCFLNKSAIAAEALRARGLRPAVLNVDVDHGNGTQGIFDARCDVLTVSVHADPVRFHPVFWVHAQERGSGAGLGANLNLPLPRGTDDAGYRAALDVALDRIDAFGADVIVVALGLDAHEHDPFQGLRVTNPRFRAIAGLGRPLLLVQEGGYVSDALGGNLTSFLTGITEGAA